MPVEVGHAQHTGREHPGKMRAKHPVFLVAADPAFYGLRLACMVFRDALGLGEAVAPVGADQQEARDPGLAGRGEGFVDQRQVVLELPQRRADEVHDRARAGAGRGEGVPVLGVDLQVLAEGVLMKAHLQCQQGAAHDPVGHAALAEKGTKRAADRSVRTQQHDLARNAHSPLRYLRRARGSKRLCASGLDAAHALWFVGLRARQAP